MKRKFHWLLLNSLFCAGIYFGYVQGLPGVRAIVMFWITVITMLAFFMFIDEDQELLLKKGRSFPLCFDVVYDIVIICVLLWCGSVYTLIVYSIHVVLIYAAFEKALKQ